MSFLKAYVLVLLLQTCQSRLNPLPDELTGRLSLTDCVVGACLNFFTEEEILTVSISPEEVSKYRASAVVMMQILLPRLSDMGRWSLLIRKASAKSSNYYKQSGSYVVQIRTQNELKDHIKNLQKYRSWNPDEKFMVISSQRFSNQEEVVAGMAETLRKAKIWKAIVMLPSLKNLTQFHIYSLFPYSTGSCGDDSYKIRIVDNCTFGHFENGTNLFPVKLLDKLSTCPIRVTVTQWPPYIMPPKQHIPGTDIYEFDEGLEINLMNTVAERAKFKVIYSMSEETRNFGSVRDDGTTSGIFKGLEEGRADVAMGSLALMEARAAKFDLISSYYVESLAWCVPHARSQPSIKKLSNTLKMETWIVLLVLLVCFSLVVWVLSRLEKKESGYYKKVPNVFQSIVSMVFGTTVKTLPRTSLIRFFLAFWMFGSLVMDIYYTTFMMSKLTDSSYVGQINTLEEILANNLHIYLIPSEIQYFTGSSWQMRKILRLWNNCSVIHDCLSKVAFERNSAFCIPRLYMEYVKSKYVDANNQPLLYHFKENIVSYPVTMYMTKGYPLKRRINTLVERIVSAGLVAAWERKVFDYKWQNASAQSDLNAEEPERKWLKISNLGVVFVFLVIGNALALIVFFLEVFAHRRGFRKSNRRVRFVE